jgi:hypothetical protein
VGIGWTLDSSHNSFFLLASTKDVAKRTELSHFIFVEFKLLQFQIIAEIISVNNNKSFEQYINGFDYLTIHPTLDNLKS